MTFQQSYDKIVAAICGVDIGLLNGKRERAMKEETFKNKILWYNSLVKYHILSRQKEQFYRKLELL